MKSHLTTKDLSTIRKKIPHGGMAEISKRTGFDQSTVSKVFKGEFHNDTIVECALNVIEESREKSKNLKSRINKL